MAIAYPQRHYEENDKRLAEKRAAEAAKEPDFNVMLYHKIKAPKGKVFNSKEEYEAALKGVGWTDGPENMSPETKKLLKKLKGKKKDK